MTAVRVVDAAAVTDADLYAEDLARVLGFAAPPGVTALADRVWGTGAIGLVSRGPDFQLVQRGRGHALFIRDDLDREVRHWTAARELARFCLERDGLVLSSAQVGGAIILPRASFARSLARVPAQVVAASYDAPLALALAREANLHSLPTAIVTTSRVTILGDPDARLPRSALHLRALATMPTLLPRWVQHGVTVLRASPRMKGGRRSCRRCVVLPFRQPEVRS